MRTPIERKINVWSLLLFKTPPLSTAVVRQPKPEWNHLKRCRPHFESVTPVFFFAIIVALIPMKVLLHKGKTALDNWLFLFLTGWVATCLTMKYVSSFWLHDSPTQKHSMYWFCFLFHWTFLSPQCNELPVGCVCIQYCLAQLISDYSHGATWHMKTSSPLLHTNTHTHTHTLILILYCAVQPGT